jgi:tetratricopeptide (TPR) repeat protein
VSDDVVALRDEIALLERSLHDARAEHARGDLDDDALDTIERRDGVRLDGALERLAAHGVASTPEERSAVVRAETPPQPRRSRRLVVACSLALVLAAGTIGVVLGRPFAAPTPAIRLDTAGKVEVLLLQGELSVATRHNAQALTAFDAVLRLEPHNAEAFVESGWLHYEAGLLAHRAAEVDQGAAMLRRAIVIAPGNGASHLYWGIVLLQHFHDVRAASAQVLRSAELPESKREESITAGLLSYLANHR